MFTVFEGRVPAKRVRQDDIALFLGSTQLRWSYWCCEDRDEGVYLRFKGRPVPFGGGRCHERLRHIGYIQQAVEKKLWVMDNCFYHSLKTENFTKEKKESYNCFEVYTFVFFVGWVRIAVLDFLFCFYKRLFLCRTRSRGAQTALPHSRIFPGDEPKRFTALETNESYVTRRSKTHRLKSSPKTVYR